MIHGTQAAYRGNKKRKPCRCAACRRWKADDMAAYRSRRREREPGWQSSTNGWHRYNGRRNYA